MPVKYICIWPPVGLSSCSFYGGGSVVVDVLFKCTSYCFWEFCDCLCFVMHYFVSILVLQSS